MSAQELGQMSEQQWVQLLLAQEWEQMSAQELGQLLAREWGGMSVQECWGQEWWGQMSEQQEWGQKSDWLSQSLREFHKKSLTFQPCDLCTLKTNEGGKKLDYVPC